MLCVGRAGMHAHLTFGLWSMIKDCLGPTPSSVFELGCGTLPLQSARQYPLKEKHTMGGKATELPPPA
jgi:hypothetical protein